MKFIPGQNLEEEDEPPSQRVALTPPLTGPSARGAKSFIFDQSYKKVIRPLHRFTTSERSRAFLKRFYPGVTLTQWTDWRWQNRNRIRTLQGLTRIISLSKDEAEAVGRHQGALPVGFTPYYASLLDRDDPDQGLRRTIIPVMNEYNFVAGEAEDPLGEDHDSPVPGLVHRYPDRVLLLVTGFCSVYCRYCTRARMVGASGEKTVKRSDIENAIDYIRRTPAIRDVLISGGDPLSLDDERIDWILAELHSIPHIEFVRIGSKQPVVQPQRITPKLVNMLRRHHPLWMSLHFTHPDELTPEVAEACARLADAGIPLGGQTVLLKGVNDNVETMTRLFQGMLKIRVRPYYLYQCDPITGSSHFRTSVEKGLEIMRGLRGHTSGYAVPTYVIDGPDGGGKIPLQHNYVTGRDGDDLILTNYTGKEFRYPDPLSRFADAPVNNNESTAAMRIGITYDLRSDYLAAGYSELETAEFDRPDTIDALYDSLARLGYQPQRIGNIRQLAAQLVQGHRWDLVLNICEGLDGFGREAQVPALLEAYGIPVTFSDTLVSALALHKAHCKRVVHSHGLPTPEFVEVQSMSDLEKVNLAYPLFAKPIAEGTGKGVTPAAKISSAEQLQRVCADLLKQFRQPVLVEAYLPGREFTVGITGTGTDSVALGTMEIVLLEGSEPEVYSYYNKENCEEVIRYQTLQRGTLRDKIETLALAAWTCLGCRDGGRIDIRLAADGAPHFLEVNPLAGLHPHHSDLPIMATLEGISYDSLVKRIIDSASQRCRQVKTSGLAN